MADVMKTILEYLKDNEGKLSDPKWQPHPIIKAMMLALHAAQEGKKDGNYMGVSGDAEQHGGVPHMLYSVVMQRSGGTYNILNVTDLTTKHTLTPQVIQRIIDAEIELEKFAGNTVLVDVAVRIMNRAIPDMNVMKLDEKDRDAAIKFAQDLIKEKKLAGVSQPVMEKVLSVMDARQWANLPSEVRSVVGTAWATKIGKSTIVITHVEDDIEKWKVREFITFSLYKMTRR